MRSESIPRHSKGLMMVLVYLFLIEIFLGNAFGQRCVQAFKYGQVDRILPWDQELLGSWGVSSYPQLLINAFIVSFIISMLVQMFILGFPAFKLRKQQFLKRSYFSLAIILVLYFDWLFFGIMLYEVTEDVYPRSTVVSTLTTFIPAGVIIGGIVAKVFVFLMPIFWGYIALPGFENTTPYLIRHDLWKSKTTFA